MDPLSDPLAEKSSHATASSSTKAEMADPRASIADSILVLPSSVRQIGAAPGIEPHELSQVHSRGAPAVVVCVDYCSERFQIEEVNDIPGFLARHRPEWSVVRWISIDGLGDLEVVRLFAEKYELHPLAVEDVMHLGQRPKAEDYPASAEHPGRLFIVAQLVKLVERRLRHEQVSLFLGRKTLVTFKEQQDDCFVPILHRIQTKDSRLRSNDVSFLLYCLLDAIVDRFFPILEQISSRLEELEEAVLDGARHNVLRDIHGFKRDLTVLRRVAWPLRELVNDLHREHHECLSDVTRTYLRDVYDHVVQVLDLVETYREGVSTLTETHMSSVSNRMNNVMKTLTIISTIFVPLTFLAGVYGMNMPIPENQSFWTYPVFWLFSLGVAGTMLVWFWHRGWFD